eukprot:3332129-Rhodomonas_salina.2
MKGLTPFPFSQGRGRITNSGLRVGNTRTAWQECRLVSVQERQPALFHLWSVQEVSGDLERWAERKHTFQMDTQMDFLWQQMGGKELILCGAFAAAGTLAVYVGKLLHGLLYYPFPGPRGGLLGVKISAATGKTLEPLFLEHSDAEFSPVSLRIHGVLVVIIAAAVDIQKANQSRPDGLHRFPVMTLLDLKPESPGLFTAEGDEWRRQRRAYAPAFNAKNVNEMLPVIKDKTARLMRIFEQREIVTDVVDLLKLCTADIICEAALGLDFNRLERAQEDDDDEKEDELRALPRLLQQRFSVSMRKLVRNAHLAILAWLTPRWFCSRWDAVRLDSDCAAGAAQIGRDQAGPLQGEGEVPDGPGRAADAARGRGLVDGSTGAGGAQ